LKETPAGISKKSERDDAICAFVHKSGLMKKIKCEQQKNMVNWPTGNAYSVMQV
jgi:hypothetical protein